MFQIMQKMKNWNNLNAGRTTLMNIGQTVEGNEMLGLEVSKIVCNRTFSRQVQKKSMLNEISHFLIEPAKLGNVGIVLKEVR